MRSVSLVLAIVVATFCVNPSVADLSEILTWSVPSRDPVSAVGHGAILDEEGKAIDPSPAFVIDAQRFYLKRLYLQSDERVRTEARSRYERVLEGRRLAERETVFAQSALIEWLVDAVKPSDAAHLLSKNNALRNRLFERDSELPPSLIEQLRQGGLIKPLATTAGGQDYRAECEAAGVPVPPDWGSSAWKSRGALPFTFIVPGPVAEVFSFENDLGVCLALPRWSGDTTTALGIICLGREASKSCFWDNWDKQAKKSFPVTKGSSVPISKFGGGADLLGGNGVCTDCHAGENPYVVHPGTPLDMGGKLIPKDWQIPLVHPAWPQNDGPTNVLNSVTLNPGEGSCLGCHGSDRRFPEVSIELSGYCNIVLKTAWAKTMAPGDIGNPKYQKHFDALQAACKLLPNKPIQVVINGATKSNPSSNRSDTSGDLAPCTDPNNCPPGFCYWRTLHGPFWQQTDSSVPIGDAKYRGSFVRIYGESGKWKWRAFSDPTGLPPNAPPGGTAECIAFKDIVKVPDPKTCSSSLWTIVDPKGTDFNSTVEATGMGLTVNTLTGFIGNVAQSNNPGPDVLRVFEQSGKVILAERHSSTPLPPFQLGPLAGESWIDACPGWTPQLVVKDVLSQSDVQLVSYPQSRDVRCFITGITGAWSSTRNNATEQPFAEIYEGPGKELRLKVWPSGDARDRVGAYASCIQIK